MVARTVLASLLVAVPAWASPAHVQNAAAIGNGTALVLTLPISVEAGDLLVGGFRSEDPPLVSDNVNGLWTLIGELNNVSLLYVANTQPAGPNGLTITMTSASAGTLRMVVDEFSGVRPVQPLEAYSMSSDPGTACCWNSGTTAAIPAGQLVWASAGTSVDGVIFTAGSTNGAAMTIGGQIQDGTNGSIVTEYLLQSVAGPQNAPVSQNFYGSGSSTNGGLAAFKVVGPPSQLAFVTPSKFIAAGACSGGVAVQLRDASGFATTGAPTPIAISSDSPNTQFFDSADCSGAAVSSVQIPIAQSSATFSFNQPHSAVLTLTANAGPGPLTATQPQSVSGALGPLTVGNSCQQTPGVSMGAAAIALAFALRRAAKVG